MLKLIAVIVPAAVRTEWLREWEAEFAWRSRRGRAIGGSRLGGALIHALWLRKEEWSFDMLQDLRYALRVLASRPSFALVAALTLALGIGANTAIFSVVYGVLLKPLPLREPDRLVQLWETNPLRNWTNATASPANFLDWKRRNRVFEDIGYYPGMDDKTPFQDDLSMVSPQGEPESIRMLQVSANLFPVLGVTPSLGRAFRPEEQVPGSQRVVILSHEVWRTRFDSDPSILGRSVRINMRDYEIVGVMPPGFAFPAAGIQVWMPFLEPESFQKQRRPHYLRAIARLKPGVTLEQARADMVGIAAQLEKEYPDTNTQMGVGLGPLHDWVVGDVRTALLVFISAVGIVLLIACANVANLLLARAAGRTREFAVRTALGAARLRIVRQLLTESFLLAIAGGLVGILVAEWTLAVLIRLSPEDLPRLTEVRIDGWVLAFMALVTGATAFLFGLVPAWQTSRIDAAALKDGVRTTSPGGRLTRRLLVVGQVARIGHARSVRRPPRAQLRTAAARAAGRGPGQRDHVPREPARPEIRHRRQDHRVLRDARRTAPLAAGSHRGGRDDRSRARRIRMDGRLVHRGAARRLGARAASQDDRAGLFRGHGAAARARARLCGFRHGVGARRGHHQRNHRAAVLQGCRSHRPADHLRQPAEQSESRVVDDHRGRPRRETGQPRQGRRAGRWTRPTGRARSPGWRSPCEHASPPRPSCRK